MSIRNKIAGIIILCLLAAFSAFYLITVASVREENTRQTTEQTTGLVVSKSSEIGLWLKNSINEFRLLSQMPAFKAMDMRAVTPYIDNITAMKSQRSSSEVADLFAYGALDGKSWVNGEQSFELVTRDEFLDIRSTSLEYIVSKPKSIDYLGGKAFMIYYPIVNYDQKRETLFIGGIKLDRINQLVEQIDVYGGTAWIMDRDGEVYTMNPIEFSHVMDYETKRELLARIDPIQPGMAEFQDSTVFYAPVPYSQRWILCTQIDHATMFANTNEITKTMTILVVLMSLLGIAFAFFVSRSIIKPIGRLQSNMVQVKSGNLSSYYTGTNKDEIYYLGQTYNLMLDTIHDLIDKIKLTEEQKRKAYLNALQAQINPHFLYNTLASLKWLAQEQKANDVAGYIDNLSSFFRISLSEGAEQIPLGQELEHAESYLKIQQFRYSDKVSYCFRVEEGLDRVAVPKLILQPLIENSIYHGLKYEKKLGHISITCCRAGDDLQLTVADDGLGIPAPRLATLQANLAAGVSDGNFGLSNIQQRLLLHYGTRAQLRLSSTYHAGSTITLTIPMGGEDHV
ncbi:MAG: sensor histidine kinase [Pseudoflavonifractor sp.]